MSLQPLRDWEQDDAFDDWYKSRLHAMMRRTAIDWIRDGSCVTDPDHKPRARQFYSRVLNRQLWRVHSPSMYDGCGTTLDGALRVFRANNQLST